MEKVNLTNNILVNLYNKHLVIANEDRDDINKKKDQDTVSFQGGFKQKILWLHHESLHHFVSDADHEMVTKILDACRMTWDDIALVNIAGQNQTAEEIIYTLSPQFVIFSLPHSDTSKEELYTLTEKLNMKIIRTDILSDIRQDKNLKISLWQILKKMFQL